MKRLGSTIACLPRVGNEGEQLALCLAVGGQARGDCDHRHLASGGVRGRAGVVAGSQSALRLLLSVVSAPATAAIRGGSAEIVTDTSGCVIRSAGLDEAGVIGRLADAIETHARDAARDEHLSAVALARAGDLDWCRQMARIQPFALARVDSGAHEKLPAARAEYA